MNVQSRHIILSPAPAVPHNLHFVEDFVLGGAVAGISKTIASPIERVKLNLQNEQDLILKGILSHPYKGPVDCTRRIYAAEGLSGFWRGNTANVIRYFPTQALNLAFFDRLKAQFRVARDAPFHLRLVSNVAAGGVAGIGSSIFVYHLDYARTRLANDLKSAGDGGARQFSGLLDVYRKSISGSDGFRGMYRGFAVSSVGILIYRGLYFGLFETIRPLLIAEEMQYTFLAKFALGMFVTNVAGVAAYPLDTVRRRMMMTSGEAVQYRSSLHCAKSILEAEGLSAFFKGGATNVVRGVSGALVLAGFGTLKTSYALWRYPVDDDDEE